MSLFCYGLVVYLRRCSDHLVPSVSLGICFLTHLRWLKATIALPHQRSLEIETSLLVIFPFLLSLGIDLWVFFFCAMLKFLFRLYVRVIVGIVRPRSSTRDRQRAIFWWKNKVHPCLIFWVFLHQIKAIQNLLMQVFLFSDPIIALFFYKINNKQFGTEMSKIEKKLNWVELQLHHLCGGEGFQVSLYTRNKFLFLKMTLQYWLS